MEHKVVHVFTTEEPDGSLSMTSPQLPGWVAIYEDRSVMMRNYKVDLGFVAERKPLEVIGHWQRRGLDARGVEYLLRWATDTGGDDRVEAANRVNRMLQDAESAEQLAHHEPDRTGVVTYVCCLSTDTLGSVVDQLDQRGDNVVVVASVADHMVFGAQIATRGREGDDWKPFDELGWTVDMTIGQLMVKSFAHAKVTV